MSAETKPTMRCTIAFGGSFQQVELLVGISIKAMDALYDDPAPQAEGVPDYWTQMPQEDGVYLLVDGKWVPECAP